MLCPQTTRKIVFQQILCIWFWVILEAKLIGSKMGQDNIEGPFSPLPRAHLQKVAHLNPAQLKATEVPFLYE